MTCRRCPTELQPPRPDTPWRAHRAARGLCKPCYEHTRNTGRLADYPRRHWPADDLLDEHAALRDQGYGWRQCAERLQVNYRTFETAMYRARRRRDPRALRVGERGYPGGEVA